MHKFPISQYSRYAYESRADVLEVVGVDVFRGKNDYALGYLSVEVTPSIFIIMGLLLSLLLSLFVLNLTDTKSTRAVTICLHKLLNALVACYTKAKSFITCTKR